MASRGFALKGSADGGPARQTIGSMRVSSRADPGPHQARQSADPYGSEPVAVDLSGVAETALWTTYQRSVEARRRDAVLDDPKAIELVDRTDCVRAALRWPGFQSVAGIASAMPSTVR